jgi:hypothetical protein
VSRRRRRTADLIVQMTREISDIGSGRREPPRAVSRRDGAFFHVRMESPDAVANETTDASDVAAALPRRRPLPVPG